MHISRKQRQSLDTLHAFISDPPELRPSTDDGFSRDVVMKGNRTVQGTLTAEEAFLLYTDQGIKIEKKQVTDWDTFKLLIIAHRRLAITIAMWKEDIKAGLLFASEFRGGPYEHIVSHLLPTS